MLIAIRERMKKSNNEKGFTLVELMVVLVIIGILVAIAVPVYNNVTDNALNKTSVANNRVVVSAVQMYQGSTANGALPTTLAEITPFIAGGVLPAGTTVTFNAQVDTTVTSVSTAGTPVTTTTKITR